MKKLITEILTVIFLLTLLVSCRNITYSPEQDGWLDITSQFKWEISPKLYVYSNEADLVDVQNITAPISDDIEFHSVNLPVNLKLKEKQAIWISFEMEQENDPTKNTFPIWEKGNRNRKEETYQDDIYWGTSIEMYKKDGSIITDTRWICTRADNKATCPFACKLNGGEWENACIDGYKPSAVLLSIIPSEIRLSRSDGLFINPDYDDEAYSDIVGIKNIEFMVGTAANVSIHNFKVYTMEMEMDEESESSTGDEEGGGLSTGTGFFIDVRGYIATNNHVIEDANDIMVVFNRNGVRQMHSAEVVKRNAINDVAIIHITDSEFRPFSNIPYNFSISKKEMGEMVYTLGYPVVDVMGFDEPTLNKGEISSVTGVRGDATMYQISVPIHPGNSGGPLFDEKGNLVGITSSGLDKSKFSNVNYAVKSNYLYGLIEALPIDLKLPNDVSNDTLSLPQQIKKLKEYVVLIIVE